MGQEDVLSLLEDLYNQPNVIHAKAGELRKAAESFSARTVFENYNFASIVKNRNASLIANFNSQKVGQCNLNQRQRKIP